MSTLFLLANAFIVPFWLLLLFRPRARWTWRLVHSGAPVLILASAYLILLVASIFRPVPGAGFDSLEGVMTLFTQPLAVLVGWLHYLAFDLFIGSWVARDAQRWQIPHHQVWPCVLLCLLLGPTGLLSYTVVRRPHSGTWALTKAPLNRP